MPPGAPGALFSNDVDLPCCVAVHGRIATAVLVLRGVAHTRGVTLAGRVAAIDRAGKLAVGLLGGAIFGITQHEVGAQVAVVVYPRAVRERCGVVVHLCAGRGRDAGQPARRAAVGQVAVGAATDAEPGAQ